MPPDGMQSETPGNKPAPDLDRLFEEGTEIDEAIAEGVRQALLRHKKLGHPIVVSDNGRIVWIPAEEIRVE